MKVMRLNDAKPYDAKLHHKMEALRLQGLDATDVESFSVGLSYFSPGGGAEMSSSPNEKVYIVLDGEVTIITEDGETQLGPMDSCFIAINEQKAVENRSNKVATMLVIVSTQPGDC